MGVRGWPALSVRIRRGLAWREGAAASVISDWRRPRTKPAAGATVNRDGRRQGTSTGGVCGWGGIERRCLRWELLPKKNAGTLGRVETDGGHGVLGGVGDGDDGFRCLWVNDTHPLVADA